MVLWGLHMSKPWFPPSFSSNPLIQTRLLPGHVLRLRAPTRLPCLIFQFLRLRTQVKCNRCRVLPRWCKVFTIWLWLNMTRHGKRSTMLLRCVVWLYNASISIRAISLFSVFPWPFLMQCGHNQELLLKVRNTWFFEAKSYDTDFRHHVAH